MILTPLPGHEIVRWDDRPASLRPGEVLLFSCVRNEALRLPFFLDYYRALGVSRFFVLDNASADGTSELLLRQPDVHLFHTTASYGASHCGVHWMNALLDRFASGHWVIVADADELLVFPDCESTGIHELVQRLDTEGSNGLLTFLLDMYSDGPIREAHYRPGTTFLSTCPFFDTDSYTRGSEGLRALIPERGGVRQRLFWRADREHRGRPPFLQKIPLVKWHPTRQYTASTHLIDGVRLTALTGALLHFKLFADFAESAIIEAARGEHWDGAAQYSVYAEALRRAPDMNPIYEGSARYRDSGQLVDMGLILKP